MRRIACLLLHFVVLVALATPLQAAPIAVPEPLQPWRGWALQDDAFRECALVAGRMGQQADDFLCAWPGTLRIDADAGGAQFSVRVQVQADSWVSLPGDTQTWPQDVRVDGQARPVIETQGRPRLRLAPGDHQIVGHFEWDRRPQALPVPMAFGVVRLQVDGAEILPVQHANDALVLGRGASEAPEADTLTLRVYRRVQDGVPAMLETIVQIGASGQAREEVFGPVLPAGYAPTALSVAAGWPARLEPDGRLRVQVQPASTEIRIFARALAPLESVGPMKAPAPWPQQEIWSFEATPSQRITHATGPAQVDPAQAGVPGQWRGLPAFALSAGDVLSVEERSRGLGADEANRLSLRREAWLDFSGAGWTFHDLVSGQMRQGWRLDVAPPYRLEQARDLGEDAPLLVTKGANGATGVEWRTTQVQLSAGLRMEPAQRAFKVSGWTQTFDGVDATIHLPFGYRLLAAPGADRAQGSWVDRWSLLDIFLVAVIVLFAWHALGRAAAGLALAYLLLALHEPGAPLLWLGIPLALALGVKALPEGRLHRFGTWLHRGALVVLVLFSVPFAAAQLRQALYPQLEPSTSGQGRSFGYGEGTDAAAESAVPALMEVPPPPPAAPAPMQDRAADAAAPQEMEQNALGSLRMEARKMRKADILERYTKNTIVQTGRGLPTWRHGHTYQLAWSGPVTADQDVRLLISPPWLTRLGRVVSVLALAWLLLGVAANVMPRLRQWRRPSAPTLAPLAMALLFVPMVALASPVPTEGGVAPPDVLAELKTRLTRPPSCAPECVALAAATVDARGDRLVVVLDLHADTRSAVPVPTDIDSLTIDAVRVDGSIGDGIRNQDGRHVMTLDRGVHRVELEYRITGDRVALAFPLPPRRIAFAGDGWQAGGIHEGRLLTETLGINRVRVAQAGRERGEPAQEFPPFVRVERTLSLGLDWTVRTTVMRIAPAEGGFSVTLPLLPGEKVLTPGLRVREGRIDVPMPDGVGVVAWDSALDKTDALAIEAPGLADRAETWRVLVSPLWRATFSGLPESVPVSDQDDDWHEFTFHPLPGEKLAIALGKPEAVEGATQAILNLTLRTEVGQRASEYTLDFRIRASQGGERVITLPAGAELLGVQRDGQALSLRLEGGKLSLAVSPGDQQYTVRFRDAQKSGFHNTTPAIGMGLPAANIDLALALPENRWVLATHGPRVGPAVLYWGELAVLLLVAFGLSRLRWTPLRLRDWLLLGVGFSTFSWIALSVVVLWLFAMAWREKQAQAAIRSVPIFDAVQLVLAALTLAAVLALITAIPLGLLGRPDMHIIDPQGYGLNWFADQSRDALPVAGAFTVPMWLYRAAMLAWALWLAIAVLAWFKWAVKAWTQGGYWRPLRKPKGETPPSLTPAAEATPSGD